MFVRALAAVLGAASLAMLVHSVANPLYDDQVNAGAIWDTLSWIMAVGFPLALVMTYRLKTEATASEAGSAGAILSTVAFYVTVFVAVVFFRIFISSLVHVEAEDAIRRIWWVPIDAFFVVIAGYLAIRLSRNHPWTAHVEPASR